MLIDQCKMQSLQFKFLLMRRNAIENLASKSTPNLIYAKMFENQFVGLLDTCLLSQQYTDMRIWVFWKSFSLRISYGVHWIVLAKHKYSTILYNTCKNKWMNKSLHKFRRKVNRCASNNLYSVKSERFFTCSVDIQSDS